MTPEQLSQAIRTALERAARSGRLGGLTPEELPSQVVVERPKVREHGDYATNIALQLAKRAGCPPRVLADAIAQELLGSAGIAAVEIAGPGFLNVRLESAAAGELAHTIVSEGAAYGRTVSPHAERVNLEYVSANPTGPIHIGGVRWAAVGDSLARILQATGHEVAREYYFNDHGVQIDRFARSLLAAAQDRPIPEDGYGGAYIGEIAASIVKENPDALARPGPEAQEIFRREGVARMFAEIRQSLHDFGVDFDVYFHENSLHESGAVDRAVARLRDLGRIYEADGATWLRSSDLGDDKDRVVIKSDGQPAYISSDLAYYLDKRERGFDRIVIMLGADHHGYVARMMAMCRAFGDEPGRNLEILIGQLVHLVKDGEPLKMSKRAGTVITLEDLVEAVGVDAGRYALARASSDSQVDIDLDLLVRRTNDNPVYYVQYAHARTCNVRKNAAEVGIGLDAFEPGLLDHPTETELLGVLGEFPRVITTAGDLREPHRVARYLETLAGTYHRWYDACRIIPRGDEAIGEVNTTRAWLNEATRIVLASGLALLGVSAPERM